MIFLPSGATGDWQEIAIAKTSVESTVKESFIGDLSGWIGSRLRIAERDFFEVSEDDVRLTVLPFSSRSVAQRNGGLSATAG